jgi:hypothetical protein
MSKAAVTHMGQLAKHDVGNVIHAIGEDSLKHQWKASLIGRLNIPQPT